MIPFLFTENRFSFFVEDHLLVGQLCTNPISDRSLLSCLKVTQCSTSEIGDAPLYNSCPLPIQVMTTGPFPAPSKCKSGRFNVPRVMKTKFPATIMVFGVVSSEGHIMPLHIFEVGLKVNNKVYLDVLKSGDPLVQSGGRWQNLGVAVGLGSGLQVQRNPGLASEGVSTTLYPSLTWTLSPDLNPLDYFIWSYVKNITNMTSHNTKAQPDRRHPPSICRAPAGACGKGVLPVPYPYRGGDCGWKRLHWIDVSSTT